MLIHSEYMSFSVIVELFIHSEYMSVSVIIQQVQQQPESHAITLHWHQTLEELSGPLLTMGT